jgi:hypothetical protein
MCDCDLEVCKLACEMRTQNSCFTFFFVFWCFTLFWDQLELYQPVEKNASYPTILGADFRYSGRRILIFSVGYEAFLTHVHTRRVRTKTNCSCLLPTVRQHDVYSGSSSKQHRSGQRAPILSSFAEKHSFTERERRILERENVSLYKIKLKS